MAKLKFWDGLILGFPLGASAIILMFLGTYSCLGNTLGLICSKHSFDLSYLWK